MIGIVIPLKSRQVSSDWDSTQRLLQRTIRSVLRQSAQLSRIFLVCHEPPQLEEQARQSVELVKASFPPPVDRRYELMYADMLRKIAMGVDRAREFGVEWFLRIDADDLLAKTTLEFILNSSADAVVFRRGIIAYPGRRWYLVEKRNFHRICGSSIAVKKSSHWPYLDFFVSSRTDTAEAFFGAHGVQPQYPRFSAACYVQSSGDQQSRILHPYYHGNLRERVGWLRRLRPMTGAVRDTFGLELLSDS